MSEELRQSVLVNNPEEELAWTSSRVGGDQLILDGYILTINRCWCCWCRCWSPCHLAAGELGPGPGDEPGHRVQLVGPGQHGRHVPGDQGQGGLGLVSAPTRY